MINSNKLYTGVFLDRDGTINVEAGYIYRVEDFKLYEFSAEAIKRLNKLGLRTVVVTNQSGVARGFFDEKFVEKVNRKMIKLLNKGGASIDGIYYCPHLPQGKVKKYAIDCDCRKPKTGMIVKAASDLNIDLKKSFIIGDRVSDFLPGKELNMTTILVLTGYGEETYKDICKKGNEKPDYVAKNLLEAVNYITEKLSYD
ncbi:D-glycero-beta-D-manno-heptose-1,7-bisphosphate 7-phosphatase [candidate division KSB1 bacterium]|nr:MAG: D-glycero-beta-D-manno-heptose-1,7-bisphosphate 7-phosphatase [candidate division KSB1 bacterium]